MDFIQTESPLGELLNPAPQVCQGPLAEVSHSTPVVFVVDEDRAVRESLELLICQQGWQPKTFSSAEEFLASPLDIVPSCLLLEVRLPGLNGLDLQKRVAIQRPDIPIIFLSADSDVRITVRAMKAGAAEFFTKPFQVDDLIRTIQEELEQSQFAIAQETEKRDLQARYASLSIRERQVMALVSSGLLNKQVGAELGISEVTVKAHRGQVMQKMHAASLADLVKMAGKLRTARGRDSTGLCEQSHYAAYPRRQLFGRYAFAP